MATLEQLEHGLQAADAAGNTDDAKAFADEIRWMRQSPSSPLGAAAAQAMQPVNEDAPSMLGSASREVGRSAIPTGAGFLGGAGAGALAGMAGGPFAPVTVPAAALVGGLVTAMGARGIQDAVADEVAPDSWMGSKSSALDYQTNPGSTLVGGLVAGGKPSVGRVLSAGKSLASAEGRQVLGQAIGTLGRKEAIAALQHSNPAALNRLGDVVDVASGAGIGAGMSLASGESLPMVGANLLGGAVFNKPWVGGSKAILPEPLPAGNGPMVAPAENGPAPMRDVTPAPAALSVARGPMTNEGSLMPRTIFSPDGETTLKIRGPVALPSGVHQVFDVNGTRVVGIDSLRLRFPEAAKLIEGESGQPSRGPMPQESPLAAGPSGDQLIQQALSAFRPTVDPSRPSITPENPMVAREMANRLSEIAPKDAEGKPLDAGIPAVESAPVRGGGAPRESADALRLAMENAMRRNPDQPLPEPMRKSPEKHIAEQFPLPLEEGAQPQPDISQSIRDSLFTDGKLPESLAGTNAETAWKAIYDNVEKIEGTAPEIVDRFADAVKTAMDGGDTPEAWASAMDSAFQFKPAPSNEQNTATPGIQQRIASEEASYPQLENAAAPALPEGGMRVEQPFAARNGPLPEPSTGGVAPEQPVAPTIRERLQQHSERVGASIQSDIAEGRLNVVFPGLDQVTAKRVYKAAIDTVVAAMDAGDHIGKAVNKAIVAAKQHLGSRFSPEIEKELRGELRKNAGPALDEHRTRVRKTEEFARKEAIGDVKDGVKPTEAEFKQRLAEDLPDQREVIDKGGPQKIHEEPGMKQGDYPDEGKSTEWKDYADRSRENAEKVFSDIKSTKAVKDIGQKLSDTRRELFTSKSSVAHEVADGAIPGTTKSEVAKEFVNDVLGSKPGAGDVANNGADSDMNRGVTKRTNKLDSIFGGLKPRMERMGAENRKAFLSRLGDLMTSESAKLSSEPNDVQEAIKGIRESFDSTREDLKNAGYDVGDFGAESMPRIFDAEMRAKNPTAFHRDLVETYKAKFKREITEAEIHDKALAEKLSKEYTDAEALKRALAYENKLSMNDAGIATDGDDFKLQGEDGVPNFLKGREFGEEADRLLGKYYVRNPFEIAKTTAEHAERLIAIARVLGNVDPKTQRLDRLGRWNDVVKKLREEGNEKMVPELARIVSATFGLGNRPSPRWQKFSEFTRTWMWLSYLDRATVSSLGEPLLAGINSRSVGNAAKSFATTIKQAGRRLAKLPANEIQIIAEQLGYVQSGLMSRLASAHASDPFASGAAAKVADGFFNMTGLTGWTHSTTEAALDIGMDYLATLAKLSKSSKLAARDLKGLGIDPAEFATLDGFADNLRKGNRLAEITGDSPGAKIMRKGLDVWMRRSAINPTQGDKAMHASHPVGSMFYGLQSYLYAYTKHVSGKLLRDMRAAVYEKDLSAGERAKLASGLPAAMLGMGAANFAITMLREAIFPDPERKKRDAKKSQEDILKGRLLASASRANFLGPYDPLFNAIAAAKYQRDPATVMVGPVWGAASELFGEIANQGGGRDSPNTNTSERKIAKLAYSIGAKPAMSAVLSGIPATRAAGVINYGLSHPMTRDAVVTGVAGPMKSPQQAKRKKGPMPEF